MGCTHHDGISVYGSGLAVGKKYNESYVGASGIDGLFRMDVTRVTTSGVSAAVSTRLSSIIFAAGQWLGATLCSGQDQIYLNWSGHVFDVTLGTGDGTPAASSLVAVVSFGR